MNKLFKTARVVPLLITVTVSSTVFAAEAPLFAENATLGIRFELELDELCLNPIEEPCADLPGAIIYADEDGSQVRLDVKVRSRGRWSRRTSRCRVPALFIFFDASQTENTVFEGQTMLPFTSHCKTGDRRYHMYALLEFLAHRIYNVITDASLRVRLAQVDYMDGRAKPRFRRYGFFVEHFKDAARRLDAEIYEVETLDPRRTDPNELAALSLFQFMIANLDWSVIKQHNVVLFRRSDGLIIAVPYDFDYSGIVDAEYAAPPDWAGIRTVRGRVFRGYCWPNFDWVGLFARFQNRREEIMALIPAVDGLSFRAQRNAGVHLRKFWRILGSEKLHRKGIIDECRRLPPPISEDS